MIRELPPTAGLPLVLGDLFGSGAEADARLAATLGHEGPILVSSGAGGLWLALETLKSLRPERRVVVLPGFTCPLVALAVQQAGLLPRLCDTRAGHFDLDPDALRRTCGEDTLAVITTHLGGRVADAAGATAIAHAAGAYLVEDAAQALGASTASGPVGLAGDIGVFSLGAGKGLSIFAGGLLVAKDARIRDALRAVEARWVPSLPGLESARMLQVLGLWALYRPAGLWFAYGRPLRAQLARGDLVGALAERFDPRIRVHRVGPWRRGVAARAARRLAGFLDAGRERAARIIPRLESIAGVEVLRDAVGDIGSWPYFLLRLPDEASRDRALDVLWTAGLGVSRAFCHALPDYPELAGFLGHADLPQARDFAARTLTVTNSPWLREDELERILAALRAACQAGSVSK